MYALTMNDTNMQTIAFILTVSGQILMAIIVSHFGFLDTPKDPISVKKVIGAVCIVFGVILSTL